jgi:hypothetical protein
LGLEGKRERQTGGAYSKNASHAAILMMASADLLPSMRPSDHLDDERPPFGRRANSSLGVPNDVPDGGFRGPRSLRWISPRRVNPFTHG